MPIQSANAASGTSKVQPALGRRRRDTSEAQATASAPTVAHDHVVAAYPPARNDNVATASAASANGARPRGGARVHPRAPFCALPGNDAGRSTDRVDGEAELSIRVVVDERNPRRAI